MQETGEDSPDASRSLPSGHATNQGFRSAAVVPAADQQERYSMQCRSLGVAIIINNKKFDQALRMGDREGTDTDATNLYRCFGQMGFKSISFRHNLKCADIRKVLRDAAAADHSQHAMFACAILSHGDMGKIYGTDGSVPLQEIIDIAKEGKGLDGKPKLFVIQACRGSRLDPGVVVTDAVDAAAYSPPTLYNVPVERDFLIAYSSTPGFFSWRNSSKGSCFIRVLCEELSRNCRTTEIMKILTVVNRRVATEFNSETVNAATTGMKQMPCITTMLTKELFISDCKPQ